MDHDVFSALFAAHSYRVLGYALRRVPDAAADDVVAETFTRIWRAGDELPADALPWLLGIARNVIREYHRGMRRQDATADKLATNMRTTTIEAGADVGDADEVRAAMACLAESDREILQLRAWDDLDPAQIADVLGCSAATARVRLHRARRRLEKALRRPRGRLMSQHAMGGGHGR